MSVTKRRQREREERRCQIIEAAAKVFKSKGFVSATMDDIAAEAELSKGTLYLHYKSKDDLFIALSSVKLGQIIERFEQIAAEPAPGVQRLEAMLHAYAETALADPEMFRTAVVWLSSAHDTDTSTAAFCEHHEQVVRLIGFLVCAIELGRTDGSIGAGRDAIAIAGQIWGGMLGTLLVRINAKEIARTAPQLDFEAQVPGFIELVCNGLRHGVNK